jgi:hypothetical protein
MVEVEGELMNGSSLAFERYITLVESSFVDRHVEVMEV